MKIVIDAYFAMQKYGGVSVYTKELVNALVLNPNIQKLTLFYNYFRNKKKIWGINNTKCKTRKVIFPKRLLFDAWNSYDWPPVNLFCGSFDIYHGTHFVLPAVREAKRVLTVHDLTYLKYPQYFFNYPLNERGYKKELPASLEKTDAVIAVSEQTRDDLIEIFNYPQDKIKVIYHGVEKAFYQELNENDIEIVLKNYGISRPYIVYVVGTPEPRKNIPRTVEAWEKLSSSIPLVLVGEKESIIRMIGFKNDNLICTGYVSNRELRILLKAALLALYPSLYEGFGLPLLESMAAGVPVITSNTSCLPEVSGGAAILVNPNNADDMAEAIRTLLNDNTLRRKIKERGLKRSAKFTWEKSAEKTVSLYKELI